ncbi:MAG TPA: hypothetical protein VKE96_14425 [Vicinamibacterales bacterium]|nr:hypothetical protein [Vicinamibacterales bacterium]
MTRRAGPAVAAGTIAVWMIACGGGMPAPPDTPTAPTPAPPPTGGTINVTGAWNGTGSDPQGAEKMSWALSQSGDAVTGTADLAPLNAADGSCASCHKFKAGTVSGTVSGSTVAIRLVFPAGGDGVPTPMCTITFNATASAATHDRIDATYTGDDTCEGPFTGGTFTMTR